MRHCSVEMLVSARYFAIRGSGSGKLEARASVCGKREDSSSASAVRFGRVGHAQFNSPNAESTN